jgi:hypothetical protein
MTALRLFAMGALLFLVVSNLDRGEEFSWRDDPLDRYPPTAVRYFQSGVLAPEPDLERMMRRFYSAHLAALREPSLRYPGAGEEREVYRLLWLRTFQEPVAVRVVFSPDAGATLFVKITDGYGGYEAGRLRSRRVRALSVAEIATLRAALARAAFWSQPVEDAARRTGIDGVRWIVEGADRGRYHVVHRWSPESGPFKDLGLILLKLGQVRTDPLY